MRFLVLFIFIATLLLAEDYKQSITHFKQEIAQSQGQQKSQALLQLAITYYKDQEQELAFKTFLEAIELTSPISPQPLKPTDLAIYDKALHIYLNQSGISAQEMAVQIREQFAAALEKSPENYGLGFLMATAYANLQLYEDFFCTFYRAYQAAPNHFLAHKIKAILYLKLFEMSRTPEEREMMRDEIVTHAEKALEKYPQDTSLHKFVIQFAKEKTDGVDKVLKKIIFGEATIARSDILFYVQQAIEVKKFELAQQFINKMREHYQFSRMLSLAQERLDESKGE